jgi:hypothetical protein
MTICTRNFISIAILGGWQLWQLLRQPPQEYDTIRNPDGSDGDVAILYPEPFQFISGELEVLGNARGGNFSNYRVAYFEGLSPADIHVIAENVTDEKENAPLALWDVRDLNGLYTLLLTVIRNDGSFDEYSVPVSIDNTPPTVDIIFPLEDQTIFQDEEWVIVQARVNDDVSVDQVEFFIDNAGVPFAISTVPPFTEKWAIPNPGCHTFRVVARDAAGNESESSPVRVCIVAQE